MTRNRRITTRAAVGLLAAFAAVASVVATASGATSIKPYVEQVGGEYEIKPLFSVDDKVPLLDGAPSFSLGASIGTAVLSTLAADAATAYVGSHAPGPATLAQAAIESYTTAFGWAAVLFAVAAVVCGALMRPGRPAPAPAPDGVPVMVH